MLSPEWMDGYCASACEELNKKFNKLNGPDVFPPFPPFSQVTKKFREEIYEAHISSHMTQHRIIFNHSH